MASTSDADDPSSANVVVVVVVLVSLTDYQKIVNILPCLCDTPRASQPLTGARMSFPSSNLEVGKRRTRGRPGGERQQQFHLCM